MCKCVARKQIRSDMHWRKIVLMITQILPSKNAKNVWKQVKIIYILILGLAP